MPSWVDCRRASTYNWQKESTPFIPVAFCYIAIGKHPLQNHKEKFKSTNPPAFSSCQCSSDKDNSRNGYDESSETDIDCCKALADIQILGSHNQVTHRSPTSKMLCQNAHMGSICFRLDANNTDKAGRHTSSQQCLLK
jgi:hypothetical protein